MVGESKNQNKGVGKDRFGSEHKKTMHAKGRGALVRKKLRSTWGVKKGVNRRRNGKADKRL